MSGPYCGKRVEIFGLRGKPELNGTFGLASSYDASRGRYTVALEPPRQGEQIALRPTNLKPAEGGGGGGRRNPFGGGMPAGMPQMPNLDWRAAVRKVRPWVPAFASRRLQSDKQLGIALGVVALAAYWLLKAVLTVRLLMLVGAVAYGGTRPQAQPYLARAAGALSRVSRGRRVTPRAVLVLACVALVLGSAAWGWLAGGGLTANRARYARQRARTAAGSGGGGAGAGDTDGGGSPGDVGGGYFDPNPGGALDIVDAYEMGFADAGAGRQSRPPPLRRQYQDQGGIPSAATASSSSSSGGGFGLWTMMRWMMLANMIHKLGKAPGGGGWSPTYAMANARNMPVYNWLIIASMLGGIF